VTPRLVFRPEAEAELLDARNWYEAERVGLGAVFAAAVETTITEVLQNPLACPRVRGDTLRAPSVAFRTPCTSALPLPRSLSWRSCTAAGTRGVGARAAESNFRYGRAGVLYDREGRTLPRGSAIATRSMSARKPGRKSCS
jgi:hypothetical protein